MTILGERVFLHGDGLHQDNRHDDVQYLKHKT